MKAIKILVGITIITVRVMMKCGITRMDKVRNWEVGELGKR